MTFLTTSETLCKFTPTSLICSQLLQELSLHYYSLYTMLRSTSDDTLDTIQAMCQQESGYQVVDYLTEVDQQMSQSRCQESFPVDDTCRSSMAQWCQKMVEFCNYDHSTTAMAMSCVDRYFSTPEGFAVLFDRSEFQLVVMTAFYTAAKINEAQALEPISVSKLSRGLHSAESIEAMEMRMLTALNWRVNPPTCYEFVRQFVRLIPAHMRQGKGRQGLSETIDYQLNASISDYRFSLCKASSVALAALLNALDIHDPEFSQLISAKFCGIIGENADNIRMIQFALYDAMARQSSEESPIPASIQRQYQTIAGHLSLGLSTKPTLLSNPVYSGISLHQHPQRLSPRVVSYPFAQI